MAPIPEEMSGPGKAPAAASGVQENTVIISGISGAYPRSRHMDDFIKILYNEVDPVAESELRWNYSHPEVPSYAGTVPDLDRFDAQFFKVSCQSAKCVDPMSRKIMEHVYRAIYDAGLSADHLSGRKVGVFVGTSLSEAEKAFYYDMDQALSSSLPGCSKSMFANRISYWLNITGPSVSVDDSCASSMVALEQAFLSIKRGECESAIVAGASITIHPQSMIHFGRLIKLCKDGKTKSFDQNADGCVKSEAICVLFLQKKEDAMRIYAEVVHVKSECDFTMVDGNPSDSDGFYRNPKQLANFINAFYKKAKVLPHDIEYVESFGSGDAVADKAELEAIQEAYCKDRKDPLLIGSVTSNIGYTEAASGLCGVTKVLLGYQTGILAANLHCSQPRQDIEALREGRMRLLTNAAPFGRTYAAVNGLSATGVNSHVLLRGKYKSKKITTKYNIPRLVALSGRQESAVQAIIDDLSCRPIDVEELALLYNIHEEKNIGHLGRGFAVLDSKANGDTVCLASRAGHYDDIKRPLWFVYSGMGSQWAGMGKQLMRIPAFATAIQRCDKILKPRGLDIVNIITSEDKTIFDNVLHSFVGIASVQIGLTDVLKTIGIIPDKIMGYSLGEVGCAYADGCLSDEEAILSAYFRGKACVESKLRSGSMAAVGIGSQQVRKMNPADIDVACHNGPDFCTISGSPESMRQFVTQLNAQGIFAKELPSSNIAFHSRYISEAGPKLLKYLSELIKSPKRRSDRWLSTSVPQERWNEEIAQYCSASYLTNNLLNPVFLEETSRLVPAGAVLIEVAPHGQLQAILKRTLPADCRNIPLTKRGHPDNALFFLQAIGQLYMQGYVPKIKNLYPTVEFPVSTGTPSLSHLVEWNHSDVYVLPTIKQVKKDRATINCSPLISIHDSDSNYLRGHVVNGKNVFPFSGALMFVWDTFAMSSGVARSELSVQFRDVKLYAQPLLHDKRHLPLKITIQMASGDFEVVNPYSKVATGNISQYLETLPPYDNIMHNESSINSKQIYKLLEDKDYSYLGDFCSIFKSNNSFTEAELIWKDNWVTLIEGMIQLNMILHDHSTVSQPKHILNLIIDPKTHDNYKTVLDGNTVIPAVVKSVLGYTRCGGVLMEKVQFYDFPSLKPNYVNLLTPDIINTDGNMNIASKCDLQLQIKHIGELKSLSWEIPNNMTSLSSKDLVTVHFAGISMYDVNVAMGVTSPKQGYGNRNVYSMEYSGTFDNGERVMGLMRGGAASTHVTAVPGLTWPIPESWTLEDAATVPLAYALAFYCLGIKAPLQPGMKILVHGGSGALGQAAISIALAHQCKVVTTVSDDKKKKLLLQLFPDLTDNVIGCSRDKSFVDLVMDATDGEGCDIIISCVTGDLKNATLKCARFCGITIDVSQAHNDDTFLYGMSFMCKQKTYVQVDFFSIFESDEYVEAVQMMMSEGIARGYVRPLLRVTYDAQESTNAFRLLASSQHRGRVLLRLPRDAICLRTGEVCGVGRKELDFERKTLLQEISELADIVLPDNIEKDTTLQEIRLNNRYVKAVSVLLQCKYHISISDEQIPQITVQKLSEIDSFVTEPEFKQSFGLPAFFTQVAEDELLGSANIVVLPTLVKSLTVNDGDVDLSRQHLCCVGGVEGQHARFSALCTRLKMPALVLQPPISPQLETLHHTAQRYVQILKTKTNLEKYNEFYLLGYECGVVTALEMAAILEKDGLKGTVFCVGGSPKEVLRYIKSNLLHLDTEDKLQTALIQHMIAIMSNVPIENIDMSLVKGSSLQDKLDSSLRGLMTNVSRTTPYVRAVIEAAYARIQQVLLHEAQAVTLKSRVVLINTNSTRIEKIDDVKSLSLEPVTTQHIDAPLMYAIEHPKCASIVNNHLSSELLEVYQLENHCDVFAPAEDIFNTISASGDE